jgi:hypothetical protein
MGLWDGVVHLLGRDNATKASITTRGAKGALAVESLDSSGNQMGDVVTTGFQAINALAPSRYDYISLSYTGSNLTGVVYKYGGAGGTTISTLVLAYDGSNNLISITKS